ncbi:MAG: hypothetical protein GY696_39325 [Gammaproteobacteria bacterium]|nr:hypothetical protein [Gammaproteobacteria bacterium]
MDSGSPETGTGGPVDMGLRDTDQAVVKKNGGVEETQRQRGSKMKCTGIRPDSSRKDSGQD